MADLSAIAGLSRFAPSGGGGYVPPSAPTSTSSLLARLQAARSYAPGPSRIHLTPFVPHQSKPKGRSLFGQFRDIVTGLPAGIGHVGYGLGRELYNTAAMPFRGGLNPRQHTTGIHPSKILNDKEAPFSTGLIRSFGHTAMDIRHPSRYAEASRKGEILQKIIEDATNASLVLSPAARALGAAAEGAEAAGQGARAEALAKAGGAVDRVAHLGGQVAESPFLPLRATASLARQGIDLATERGLPALGERFPGLAERAPTVFTEAGREGRLGAKEAEWQGRRQEAVLHRIGRKLEATGATPDEQAAAYAVVSGQAHMIPVLRGAGLGDEAIHGVLSPVKIEGAHLTPEAARIAEDFVANPETNPTVAHLVDTFRGTRDLMEAKGTNPENAASWAPKLDEYSTSNEVLDVARNKWIAENQKELAKIGKSLTVDEPGLFGGEADPVAAGASHFFEDPERFPELADSWHEIEMMPESYAARWRPRMMEAQRAQQSLNALQSAGEGPNPAAANVPFLPNELERAGVSAEYLPHGRPLSTVPETVRAAQFASSKPGVLGDIKLTSEGMRGLEPEAPMNIPDLYEGWGREARNVTLRNFYRDFIGKHGQSIGSLVEPEELNAVLQDAHNEAARRFPNDVAPNGTLHGAAAAEFARLRGQGILEAAQSHGMEPWPVKGEVANADIKPIDINEDTPFLKAGLREKIAKQWAIPKDLPVGWKQLETINRKFKGAVLPWSIRWQVGDAVSNALLGWVAGDVNPAELIKSMRDMKKISPEAADLVQTHAPSSGLTYGEHLSLRPENEPTPVTWENKGEQFRQHPIKTLQAPGFKLNEFINRTQRQAFTLEHLQRQLDKAGISLDDAAATPHAPEVQKALADAVKRADDALGAYDDMSPFEKRYVRQLFPFWSWIRNITRISANLVIDQPLRAAWVMRVGALGTDPNSELPDYLRGSIQTPFGLVDSNFLNAFADPTAQSILTPEGAMRSLSPGIKLAAVAGAGADLNRSGLPLSRPFGSGRTDSLGRVTGTPLALRPLELGYWLTQQTPQTRALVNLAPQQKVGSVTLGPVARYGQGSLITRHGSKKPLDTDPRTNALLSLASIPQPQSSGDVKSILASIKRRKG